jgi:hypothetical protein
MKDSSSREDHSEHASTVGSADSSRALAPFEAASAAPRDPTRRRMRPPPETVAQMIALRQAGQRILDDCACPGRPASTVSAILRRRGITALPAPQRPVQRYEWPHAGDLLHVDSSH